MKRIGLFLLVLLVITSAASAADYACPVGQRYEGGFRFDFEVTGVVPSTEQNHDPKCSILNEVGREAEIWASEATALVNSPLRWHKIAREITGIAVITYEYSGGGWNLAVAASGFIDPIPVRLDRGSVYYTWLQYGEPQTEDQWVYQLILEGDNEHVLVQPDGSLWQIEVRCPRIIVDPLPSVARNGFKTTGKGFMSIAHQIYCEVQDGTYQSFERLLVFESFAGQFPNHHQEIYTHFFAETSTLSEGNHLYTAIDTLSLDVKAVTITHLTPFVVYFPQQYEGIIREPVGGVVLEDTEGTDYITWVVDPLLGNLYAEVAE